MGKKLGVKDFMLIGMYAALYFMHVGLGTLVGVVVLHSGNMLLAPAFTGLIAGTVYLLLIEKVAKFGAITLVGAVMAMFFFLSGHFIFSFVPSLLFGLVADFIAYKGHYKTTWLNHLSYIVFSFGNFGPILLMWFSHDAYIARLIEKGKDATYINNVMVPFDWMHLILLVICSYIGILIGQYLVNKTFKKSGVIE